MMRREFYVRFADNFCSKEAAGGSKTLPIQHSEAHIGEAIFCENRYRSADLPQESCPDIKAEIVSTSMHGIDSRCRRIELGLCDKETGADSHVRLELASGECVALQER